MRIEIINQFGAENRDVYSFNVFDLNLVLVGYSIQTKPVRKRIWTVTKFWDTYNVRDSSIKESPMIPQSIREKAKEAIIERINVKTWAEWKNNN